MIDLLVFYLIFSLLGWLCFPIAFRFFPSLEDRGYAFCRTLGLLLWAYIFWLLASIKILYNDVGGVLFSLLVLTGLSFVFLRKIGIASLLEWIKGQRKYLITIEGLFLLTFVGWAIVRATNPEILGTEKPMELSFINAILRSDTFPPHDPWLSGYAISYYYFGYVMVAMIAKIGGVSGGVVFNLGVVMVFSLTALGAYGLVYDLLSNRLKEGHKSLLFSSIFGPLYVLFVGNLEGFFEMLHARGLFWGKIAGGGWQSPFWKWLDLVELSEPPSEPLSWLPHRYFWWWRASRVVQDYDFQGNLKEVINEFPAFSFLLADLHPHVLAMPFAFLAIAIALQLYRQVKQSRMDEAVYKVSIRSLAWLGLGAIILGTVLFVRGLEEFELFILLLGLILWMLSGWVIKNIYAAFNWSATGFQWKGDLKDRVIHLSIDVGFLLLLSLVLGGLAFLNTWDFPIYVVLCAGAFLLGKFTILPGAIRDNIDIQRQKFYWRLFKDFFVLAMIFGILGVFLYLPFYFGFSSQAGGIIPNLIYPTRGTHLWIMFAPLLIPIFLFFLYLKKSHHISLLWGIGVAIGISLVLWVLSLMFAALILLIPGVKDIYLSSLAAPGAIELYFLALSRRLVNNGGWLTLILLLGVTLAYIRSLVSKYQTIGSTNPIENSDSEDGFALLLILLGTFLVFIPEFFYLRDQFGWRINTIFKFYYQAWLLWAIAAAYITILLLHKMKGILGVLYQLGLGVVLFISMVYIVLGLWDKTHFFNPEQGWTLDGTNFFRLQFPDDMKAVDWLLSAQDGVVAEAVSPTGGSYSNYARISMLSGLPTVLGWVGHESQWRGGGREIGTRQADLERLYCTRHWTEAKNVLDLYHIRYIYIGNLEYATYLPGQGNCNTGLSEAKFSQNLDVVYHEGPITIYMVP